MNGMGLPSSWLHLTGKYCSILHLILLKLQTRTFCRMESALNVTQIYIYMDMDKYDLWKAHSIQQQLILKFSYKCSAEDAPWRFRLPVSNGITAGLRWNN